MPDTAYARCGELNLAYQVFGAGDRTIVVANSFVSHIELFWGFPPIKAFNDHLASYARVVIFDKAGVGLSDPVSRIPTLDDRANEIEAVMDAAGVDRAALVGISEGGPTSILFATTRPERVSALSLVATFPWFPMASWADTERTPAELADVMRRELGDAYAPEPEQLAGILETVAALPRWGSGEFIHHLIPTLSLLQLGSFERMSASPGMARAAIEAAFRLDVRPLLSAIRVPTQVLHVSGDVIPVQAARYLADHIEGASLVEIDGEGHVPWLTDFEGTCAAVDEFFTGTKNAAAVSSRALRTVVFSDIVDSTRQAADLGDERWLRVLEALGQSTSSLLDRFDGSLVKNTGDGHLATFEAPTNAIRFADALRRESAGSGLQLRIGMHTGEIEIVGEDVAGIGVHIASRVMATAGPSEIVATSVVRDLVVGSGIGFDDRAVMELRGVPGNWQLVTVEPAGAPSGSAESALIAMPTPAAATGMRTSDRAVAGLARRAPWLLRSASRVARPRPATVGSG